SIYSLSDAYQRVAAFLRSRGADDAGGHEVSVGKRVGRQFFVDVPRLRLRPLAEALRRRPRGEVADREVNALLHQSAQLSRVDVAGRNLVRLRIQELHPLREV